MVPEGSVLTLDSNVFIAALKEDEPYSQKCAEILTKIPENHILCEPSILYQEVCGTLARKAGTNIAEQAKSQLDLIVHPSLLVDCGRAFCISSYPLCSDYNVYAIDATYLKVALDNHAMLISLDKEEFTDRVNARKPPIEVYHVSEYPC